MKEVETTVMMVTAMTKNEYVRYLCIVVERNSLMVFYFDQAVLGPTCHSLQYSTSTSLDVAYLERSRNSAFVRQYKICTDHINSTYNWLKS